MGSPEGETPPGLRLAAPCRSAIADLLAVLVEQRHQGRAINGLLRLPDRLNRGDELPHEEIDRLVNDLLYIDRYYHLTRKS